MNNFNKVKEEAKKFVKENKDFFDRFSNEIDALTIGNYFDLYIGSKGISGLQRGEDFDNDYDKYLKDFFDEADENHKELVIAYLDFLIWLKKQQEIFNIEIIEKKYILKNALEYPRTINRIFSNRELDEKDKFEVLLFYYCSLQEIFKNVVQEELLLEIWKKGKTEVCDLKKKHIALGDFDVIIKKYEKQTGVKKKIHSIFDAELRNKILHADYFIESDEIKYGKSSLSKTELHDKIVKLGISLQFFVLFYLRLFNETMID